MNDEAVAKFGPSLRGALIARGHPEYEEARKLYNAMIDKLIARCSDVADVIAAVNYGRDNRLPIAIRAGGHNGPGLASVDDGLVIDLSTMKGVRVDPTARTVRVDAGCVVGDVDNATPALRPNNRPNRRVRTRTHGGVGGAALSSSISVGSIR